MTDKELLTFLEAELRLRHATHAADLLAMRKQLETAKAKAYKLTRQRDEARGRAKEYKSYVNRYQRELATLRDANRKLMEEQNAKT